MPNTLIASLRSREPRKDDDNILTFQHKGYIVLVGRNSFSNERLVADHPHRDCLWMHATAARGSHVVLCIHERQDPEEDVIQYAAILALRNSHSEAKDVTVALLKDVYKPEDAGVGVWKTNKRASVLVQ